MFRFFDNLAFPCLVTGSDAAQTGRIGILFIGKYFPLFSQILGSPDMGIFRFLADFRFFKSDWLTLETTPEMDQTETRFLER